jgi:ABC-2 type transport system permease protein
MRYFRLLRTFYKNALIAELEYRANFVVNVLTTVFWLFWAIVGLQIYFGHTDTLGGWSYDEVLIVVGVFTLANGFMQAFVLPNVVEIGNHIRLGTMDFILTKPINTQFFVSMRTVVFWHLSDVALGIAIIGVGLVRLHAELTLPSLAVFALMLLAGGATMYALALMLVTTAFWLVRIDNIIEVFNAFYQAGLYPISVYRGAVRIFFTFIIPIAFITTVPAASLIDKLDPVYAVYSVALAVSLFALGTWFWRYALRFYSSASS